MDIGKKTETAFDIAFILSDIAGEPYAGALRDGFELVDSVSRKVYITDPDFQISDEMWDACLASTPRWEAYMAMVKSQSA